MLSAHRMDDPYGKVKWSQEILHLEILNHRYLIKRIVIMGI